MQNDPQRPDDETADASFADILKDFETKRRKARASEPRKGTVVGVAGDYVLVDFGSKAEGVIPRADLLDAEGNLTVSRGDSTLVSQTCESRSDAIVRAEQLQRILLEFGWTNRPSA